MSELVLPATPRGLPESQRLAGKPPREVARDFEALLVSHMIGAMRKTVPTSGLLGSSSAHRTLDGAFDYELARSLSTHTDLGIARQLAAQIEGAAPATARPRERIIHEYVSPAARAALRNYVPPGETAASAPAVTPASAAVQSAPPPAANVHPAAANAHGPAVVLPVAGRVTSGFGLRRDPITGVRDFHTGIDVAAPRGTKVRALAAGEVVFSGRRGAAGNVVDVRHADGLTTTYAHVERRLARRGQRVQAGDVLATVGSSGRTTGPHLHLGVSRAGKVIDPAAVLGPLGLDPRRHEEGDRRRREA